jgi:hypothetical protein
MMISAAFAMIWPTFSSSAIVDSMAHVLLSSDQVSITARVASPS